MKAPTHLCASLKFHQKFYIFVFSTKFSTSSSHEPSSNKTSGLQKEHNLMKKIKDLETVIFKRLSCRGPFFELAQIINPGQPSIQMVNSNFYLIWCEVFVVILGWFSGFTEQFSNLAAKIYLCYVSWFRICELFTVLTGVISKCLKKLSDTCIGLVGWAHLIW